MKLKEILETADSELKYPISITWKVGNVWMNLASGYWENDSFVKNPNVPFRLHDGKGDSEAELAAIVAEIRKRPLPQEAMEREVIYLTIDGIEYSVIIGSPTENGIQHGKHVA